MAAKRKPAAVKSRHRQLVLSTDACRRAKNTLAEIDKNLLDSVGLHDLSTVFKHLFLIEQQLEALHYIVLPASSTKKRRN